ncbi:MAG: hypothetical protein R3E96_01505 [Planctomycetota bacterium]
MRTALLIPALLLPATALAHTDDFEGGVNGAGWRFIAPADVIETAGGNPGAWLHNASIDSFAAILRSDPAQVSPFHGDYRAAGVTSIAIDARTDATDFGAAGFEFSIVLRDTKGTSSVNDDDYAYFVGAQVPQPGQGWVHYDFAIPSADTSAVPSGWSGGWVGDGAAFRPGVDWNDVIQSVDQVEFWWINPSYFAILQNWTVGVDNVEIQMSGGPVSTFCDPAQPNSTGLPTRLFATLGSTPGSGLHLEADQGPQDQFGYLLVGSGMIDRGWSSAKGRLCLDQAIPAGTTYGGALNSLGMFDSSGVFPGTLWELRRLAVVSTCRRNFLRCSVRPSPRGRLGTFSFGTARMVGNPTFRMA